MAADFFIMGISEQKIGCNTSSKEFNTLKQIKPASEQSGTIKIKEIAARYCNISEIWTGLYLAMLGSGHQIMNPRYCVFHPWSSLFFGRLLMLQHRPLEMAMSPSNFFLFNL